METVIKKLSEIEIAAKKIMEEANAQLTVLKQQMHEKTAAFDHQVETETESKLDDLRKALQQKTDTALAKLRSDTEQELNSLHKYYAEHHNELSDAIYNKIIGM